MRFNRKHVLGACASVAGGAAILAVTMGPASAVVFDYKITTNGVATGTSSITVKNSGDLVFTDTTATSMPQLKCTTLNSTGTANNGSHLFNPAHSTTDYAGKVTPTAGQLTGCTNPLLGAVTITPSGTWNLAVSSRTATGGAGQLVGVTANLKAANCTATATGTINGTYVNSTGVLTATNTVSGLTLSNVTGSACTLVKIKNGDKANLSGQVVLTLAGGTAHPQILAP